MLIGFSHKWLSDKIMGGVSRIYREIIPFLERDHDIVTFSAHQCSWSKNHIRLSTKNINDYNHNLAKLIAQQNLDIAECSSWEYELLDFAKIKEKKTKVIVRTEFACSEINALDLVQGEQSLLYHADGCIAVSNFVKANIQNTYSDVCVDKVIHNGSKSYHLSKCYSKEACINEIIPYIHDYSFGCFLDTHISLLKQITAWLNKKKKVFLWIGKMTYMKGFDVLTDIVEKSDNNYGFIILLGHGLQQYPKIKNHNVLYFQDIPEEKMKYFYNISKFYLTTSRIEGYGIAAIELVD